MSVSVGAKVILKSGGPEMVVNEMKNVCSCTWFDEDGNTCREEFDKRTLKEVEKNENSEM